MLIKLKKIQVLNYIITMTEIHELERKIKEIIDQLKGLSTTHGLGNQAVEEEIITSVFLYKFLNDKFMYNVNKFSEENSDFCPICEFAPFTPSNSLALKLLFAEINLKCPNELCKENINYLDKFLLNQVFHQLLLH